MALSKDSVVLLGGGASMEAGIPTTFAMTERLVKSINKRVQIQPMLSALHFVCGALLAYDAASGKNPFTGLDVERVFAAVELLAERNVLEVTPFVASWHPAVDALDTTSTRIENFDRELSHALALPDSFNRAGGLIADLIDSRTGVNANGRVYAELAEAMIRELRTLVATTPKQSDYLRPLVEAGRQAGGLTIATLNYDISIEGVAQATGLQWTTGIDEWMNQGRWLWPDEGVRLLKLHGSIDWVWGPVRHNPSMLPQRELAVTRRPQQEQRQPAVVFGQRGKLRAEGPFLGLLAEFETLLGKANHLIAVGYSFRDDHVNEVITRWVNERNDRKIIVIDPNWPENTLSFRMSNDFRSTLVNSLIPREHQPKAFQPRLEIRGEKCSEALVRLTSETREDVG